nr:hypothetical protein [Tanacetum cinerariifolium]
MELDEHVPVHVPDPEHPKYHAPSDDDIQVEDDEEDPNEEHEPEDEDTKEPYEGSDETEPFEEDEGVVTPPPPRHREARISVRPQTPMATSTQAVIDAFVFGSSPFPLPLTSPAYDQAPLGHKTTMIRMRDDIPDKDMPPRRRFILTAPTPEWDVAESSAAAARAPRSQYNFVDIVQAGQGLIRSPGHDTRTIARAADIAEDVGYVRTLQAFERKMMTSIEEVNLRVSYQAQVRRQESKYFYTQLHDAQTDRRDIRLEIDASAVTYTSISSDSDGPSWGIPLMNAVHVSDPEHPEYHAPSDDDIQVEDDDEDPEEDPNKEHEPEDEDTKEPYEGSDETEPFEEDEAVVTPPPPRHREARISVRPQTPMATSTQAVIDAFVFGSSLFPLPLTSPAYDQAPLGHRTAMIRMRDDIPDKDMPPRRRFILTAPTPGWDVAESSAAAARAPRSQYNFIDTVQAGQGLIRSPGHDTRTIARAADIVEDVGYVRTLQAFERKMMTFIEEVNLRVSYQAQVRRQESKIMPVTRQETNDAMTPESIQAMIDRAIQRNSTHTQDDASQSSGGGLRRSVQPARAALTWWNGHVRTLGHDAAYAMTWGTLKKNFTDKYCPKAYTHRFQELALMCTKFLVDETEKVNKYINGLPDNIHGNVMSAIPKTLDETIELANDLMD